MKRDIYHQLKAWKDSPIRKPLVLEGARQVGKTYALKHFGKTSYEKVAYLNFEKEEQLAGYFEKSLDPEQLIKLLSIHTEVDIEPGNTLIIFDEVQECPRALNSLKYFCEEEKQYHIVAAGSLLGVKAKQSSHGFPVGKVNFLKLYPLSFFEFLEATGHQKLREYLDHLDKIEPIAEPLHAQLIDLLKVYFYVGGMPEAVATYCEHGKLSIVRKVQKEILAAYERDFSKHAPENQIMKLMVVWKQVHQQLAKENKKFIFAAIRKSARGRDYEEAIQWLVDAGLIYKCHHISVPHLPLESHADPDIFKIYSLDIGLLGAQCNLSAKAVISDNQLFREFKGALTENYVAEQLLSEDKEKLFYWTSPGTAEVDFVVEQEAAIYPLEVKAGFRTHSKSLGVFRQKFNPEVLLRSTLLNFKKDGDVINFPLYLIEKLPKFLKNDFFFPSTY